MKYNDANEIIKLATDTLYQYHILKLRHKPKLTRADGQQAARLYLRLKGKKCEY